MMTKDCYNSNFSLSFSKFLFTLWKTSDKTGEILFVPGGSPHYVENLETTLAISGNFVDLSNWRRALSELEVNGLTDPRAADLAWQFRQPTFVSNMDSCISDLPWLSFKMWPPQPSDISKMDISEQNLDFLHQKGS